MVGLATPCSTLQCLTRNKVKRPSAAEAVTTKKGNLTLLVCPSGVSQCCFLFHSGMMMLYTTKVTARAQIASHVGMRVTWGSRGGAGEGQGGERGRCEGQGGERRRREGEGRGREGAERRKEKGGEGKSAGRVEKGTKHK